MRHLMGIALVVVALTGCKSMAPQDQEPTNPKEAAEPQEQIQISRVERASAARSTTPADGAFNVPNTPFGLSSRMRIKTVDVGAGNCIAIQCPNASEALLVDCGTNDGVHDTPPNLPRIKRQADRAIAEIPDFIGNRPVNLVITHPHTDHDIFIPNVLEGKAVKGIWLGGYIKEYQNKKTLPSEYFIRTWIKEQETRGVPIYSDFEASYDSGGKQEPNLTCGAAEVSILTVNAEGSKNDDLANSHSLVTAVRYGNFQAIFPGDAEDVTEFDILDKFSGDVRDTSVLFSAHHGAQTQGSNSTQWAKALRPQVVIYNAGRLYGHPTCNAVERYRLNITPIAAPSHPFACSNGEPADSEIAEYSTERSGAIEISTDGNTFSLKCDKHAC